VSCWPRRASPTRRRDRNPFDTPGGRGYVDGGTVNLSCGGHVRTLTYLVASSIDGYITGPDGGDPTGSIFAVDGDHMQPLLEAFPEVVPTHVREQLNFHPENKNFDTVLEGRNSYQIGLDFGVTNAYRHLEHYVFSTTMTEAPDPD